VLPHFGTTKYIVLDDYGKAGRVYRESAEEDVTLESVIDDLLTGQFNNPVRVVAFNTSEGWSRDVSDDVAREVVKRVASCRRARISLPLSGDGTLSIPPLARRTCSLPMSRASPAPNPLKAVSTFSGALQRRSLYIPRRTCDCAAANAAKGHLLPHAIAAKAASHFAVGPGMPAPRASITQLTTRPP